MATSKDYISFIMEQLSALGDIKVRQMMGEYIIYYRGKIAAYVCDDRLLVKPVPAAEKYILDAKREPPYAGAKDMLLVEEVDNREYLEGLFNAIYDELSAPKPKKEKVKQYECKERFNRTAFFFCGDFAKWEKFYHKLHL